MKLAWFSCIIVVPNIFQVLLSVWPGPIDRIKSLVIHRVTLSYHNQMWWVELFNYFYLLRNPNWCLYSSRAAANNSGTTAPLCGSVPSGRRNNKMCGSGLSTFMPWTTWYRWTIWDGESYCDEVHGCKCEHSLRLVRHSYDGTTTASHVHTHTHFLKTLRHEHTDVSHNVANLSIVAPQYLSIPFPSITDFWVMFWPNLLVIWHV